MKFEVTPINKVTYTAYEVTIPNIIEDGEGLTIEYTEDQHDCGITLSDVIILSNSQSDRSHFEIQVAKAWKSIEPRLACKNAYGNEFIEVPTILINGDRVYLQPTDYIILGSDGSKEVINKQLLTKLYVWEDKK